MSLRARVVNSLYRHWLKPTIGPDLTVEGLRSRAQRLERLSGRPPRGTRINQLNLGTFVVEEIIPAAGPEDRTVLYLPGGGFVLRTPAVHRALVGRLCRQARASALLVFYRLAPENPFPAGLQDCVAAYRHLLERGIDPGTIVVGGDSAGGGMTLSLLLALRDQQLPLPAAAFTLSAVTDLRIHRDGTRTTNRDSDVMLSVEVSEGWHTTYVGGDPRRLYEPLVSPVLGDYSGLPPLLMQASSTEVLLDDTRNAANAAVAAGVNASVQVFTDVSHVWHIIPHLPEARRALTEISNFIRYHTAPKGFT